MASADVPCQHAYPVERAIEALLDGSAVDQRSDKSAATDAVAVPARTTSRVVWLLILSAALFVRGAVMLNGHSGQDKPPMHGDFEAQRHWMEVTLHLLPGEWYRHSNLNDLQYWGLDYPPLTAYVSLMFGRVAQVVQPRLVAWESSRGYEDIPGKLFMRWTVIVTDAIVWLPAILALLSTLHALSPARRMSLAATLLMSPALLLVDHGHFQYNSTSLGLALASVAAYGHDRYLLSAALFTLALNFKQMTLYYSLVMFVALLHAAATRRVLRGCSVMPSIAALGTVVILTCAALWLPLCVWNAPGATCSDAIMAMLSRLFPFDRSLFEDKVSNIWCVLEPVLRFRQRIYADTSGVVRARIARGAASLTLMLALPPLILLWRRLSDRSRTWAHAWLRVEHLLLAAFAVSSAFFLASYQVHEKSILLVWLPIACLAHRLPLFSAWFTIMATVSMWPLLAKDGLLNAASCTCIMYAIAAWPSLDMQESHDVATLLQRLQLSMAPATLALIMNSAAVGSIVCVLVSTVTSHVVSPPHALPDLYPYTSAVVCSVCFAAAMVVSWVLLLAPSQQARVTQQHGSHSMLHVQGLDVDAQHVPAAPSGALQPVSERAIRRRRRSRP